MLVDETLPLSGLLDSAASRLDGVGSATLTPILLVAYEYRIPTRRATRSTHQIPLKRTGTIVQFTPKWTN